MNLCIRALSTEAEAHWAGGKPGQLYGFARKIDGEDHIQKERKLDSSQATALPFEEHGSDVMRRLFRRISRHV